MCYRLTSKVFRARQESGADPLSGNERTARVPPAKPATSVRRQSDHLAFTGFLARLQRRLTQQEEEPV